MLLICTATNHTVLATLGRRRTGKHRQKIHKTTYTHTSALFPGLPRWAGTRKVKPIWILLKQETVSGSGISWATCKSASRSRQITMPVPYHSVFYRPDALPGTHQQHQSTDGKTTYTCVVITQHCYTVLKNVNKQFAWWLRTTHTHTPV